MTCGELVWVEVVIQTTIALLLLGKVLGRELLVMAVPVVSWNTVCQCYEKLRACFFQSEEFLEQQSTVQILLTSQQCCGYGRF